MDHKTCFNRPTNLCSFRDFGSAGMAPKRQNPDFRPGTLKPGAMVKLDHLATIGCACCCIFLLVGPFLRVLLLLYPPPFGNNRTPASSFHLYRPDLDLCVQSGDYQNRRAFHELGWHSPTTQGLKLEACNESETWIYVDRHLQSKQTKLCVTCMPTDYPARANWAYDYTSANFNPAGVVWPNCTFLAMLECNFASGSELSQRQNWSFVDGKFQYSTLYTQDHPDVEEYLINPYRIISTPLCMWVDRANATVKPCGWLDQLTALVAFDMSYFSIKDCSASDDFCYNDGTFNNRSCSCECVQPWGSLDCRGLDERRAGNLTCREKQLIGPAFQYSPAGLEDQARAVLDGSLEIWLSIVAIVAVVVSCGFGPCETCLSCCPCVRVLFFVVFTMKLALGLLWFPYYAQYQPGHWPYADRAILFCVGNVGFSSYLFGIYATMDILDLVDVVQLLRARKAENVLDDYKIAGVTVGISKASKVQLQEVGKTYSLCGVLLAQAHRNPSGVKFWLCILLLVLQVWELLFLRYFRNSNADFLRMELIFGVIQDLPEFFLCLWIALSAEIDQFVIYSQASAAISLMKQLARAQHSLRIQDGYEGLRTTRD